jgi:hypothetical protein
MTDPLPPGSRLTGELRFEVPPERVVPLFLGPEDRLEADGPVVRFELTADRVTKGFLLPGEQAGLVGAELRLDGEPLPAGRLRYGSGTPYTGRPLDASALDSVAYPPPADQPGLRLWRYSGDRPESSEIDPETRRSLEALGYIQ